MKIAITGGAGLVGRRLAERLAKDNALGGHEITGMTLYDVVTPVAPAGAKFPVQADHRRLPAHGETDKLIADRPDVIFHLAAIVSGEAEADFDKGYRINLDGTRYLLEAIRTARRRLQAARGLHLVDRRVRRAVPRSDPRRVLHDAAHLLRHAEGDRRAAAGRLHAARASSTASASGCRPSACGPGKPNKAASGFFSNIMPRAAGRAGGGAAGRRGRAPLARQPARRGRLPAARRRPSTARGSAPRRNLTHAGPVGDGRRADRGAAQGRRREGGRNASAASPIRSSQRSSPAGRAISTPSARLALGFKAGRIVRRDHPHPHRGRTGREDCGIAEDELCLIPKSQGADQSKSIRLKKALRFHCLLPSETSEIF